MSSFLQGTVIIIANHGERIDIPPGAILENKIVSGNLRILDHWCLFLSPFPVWPSPLSLVTSASVYTSSARLAFARTTLKTGDVPQHETWVWTECRPCSINLFTFAMPCVILGLDSNFLFLSFWVRTCIEIFSTMFLLILLFSIVDL